MTRILCRLGWHRWSCYAIESDTLSMIFRSRCVRCTRRRETLAGTPDQPPEQYAEYWSYRASCRRFAGAPDTGEMWEYNHARPLDAEEYDHWQTRPLPYGWSIIQPPAERLEETTR